MTEGGDLPIHPILGEVTHMLLGVIEVLGLMLLRSKLFLLSPAPNPSNFRGGDPNAIGGNRSPGVNAASQQTIFIVSGSQSIQC